MSHLAFVDANSAASTLSNLVVFKKQVTLTSTATVPYTISLLITEANRGQFVPFDVWFHVDDNSGIDTLTFTCSIGHTGSGGTANYDNVCASDVRGSSTVAVQLRQYKAVRFPVRIDSTYYGIATLNNTVQNVYLRVTANPASQIIGTFFIMGYYTGMRP